MKYIFNKKSGIFLALMLVIGVLAACGTNPQQPGNSLPDRSIGVVVDRCPSQFWPTTRQMTKVQPSSQSVYFISGIHLYALNAATGKMRWCMEAVHAVNHRSIYGDAASLLREGPPALPDGFSAMTLNNGIIYATSQNDYTYAFKSATGNLLWMHDTGFANTSAPTIIGNIVYVGSSDVYALNAQNGSQLWKYPTPDVVTSSPVIVHGTLYVGSYGDRVYALNAATGALRWQYNTGGRVYVDPVFDSGTVFFGSDDAGPTLYAVNAQNGKLLWHNPMLVDSSLAVANGVLYVGSNNALYALDEQHGTVLWHYPLSTNFNILAAKGILYIATDSSGTYALNVNKETMLWNNPLNPMHAGDTSVPVLMHGELFVGTIDLGRSLSNAYIHALNPKNGSEDWYDYVPWNYSSIGVAA